MNPAAPHKPDRLDELEHRLKALEDWRDREDAGLVGRVRRWGIVVGCVGGLLGGISVLSQMWKDATSAPHIEPSSGGPVRLSWDSVARHLAITCGLAVKNNGTAPGSVTAARAQIRPPGQSSAPPIDLDVATNFPISLRGGDARDVEFTATSDLTEPKQQALQQEGLYQVVVILQVEGPNNQRELTYCFWRGKGTVDPFARTGTQTYPQDLACLQ